MTEEELKQLQNLIAFKLETMARDLRDRRLSPIDATIELRTIIADTKREIFD